MKDQMKRSFVRLIRFPEERVETMQETIIVSLMIDMNIQITTNLQQK